MKLSVLLKAFLFFLVPLILFIFLFLPQIRNSLGFYQISRVIDGDTFEAEGPKIFRLKGVDCPEPREHECYALEAKEFTRTRLQGKILKLETAGLDSFNRTLTHVPLDQTTLEEELLKSGLAKLQPPVEEKYRTRFEKAQSQAQKQKLGLWGPCPYPQKPTPTPPDPKCPIKGNYNPKTQERLYHLPSCPNYQTTIIGNEPYERFFCTEEEAQSSSFTLSPDCP